MAQTNNWENLTTDQMSRANTIVQRLVSDCISRWNGKNKEHTAFDTYDKVEDIHNILHEND